MEIVRFFLAGYTLQRIKFSRSQTSKRPGEAKQKTLQTSKKWLAAVLLASQTRLERATPGLGGSCSIQLSYWDIYQKYSIFLRPRTRTNCRLGGGRSILLSYGCTKPVYANQILLYAISAALSNEKGGPARVRPNRRHSPKLMPMFLAMRTISWSRGTNLVLPATSLSGLWPTSSPSMPTAWP